MALAPVSLALVPFKTASQLEEEAREASQKSQAKPIIQSLASHVRERWEEAKDAKRDVEERMVDNLTRRRGQYDSQKLAQIRAFGGSEIFMGITSVKCRAACAWLRDTLMGTGLDRPWQLEHTPEPELPPEVTMGLQQALMQQVYQQTLLTGMAPDPAVLQSQAQQMKEETAARLREEAKRRIERMSTKIEDQLLEGGWSQAFSQFIDDLVTFPTAIVKGPVARNRKQLKWSGQDLTPVETVGLEWERVDPFMIYPAPWASHLHEGYLIERHRLTREALQAMIGVDGYDEAAIKTVLSDFESGGLNEWLWIDTERADAEGKESDAHDTDDLIDALQLWDSVQGSLLIEWGVPEAEVPDPFMSYPCEVWLVGGTVIRAVLNYDPLGRKPYYATSYEKVPGSFWGNSVVDLVKDPQDMVNASARALANNMGIACLTADTVVYRNGTSNDPSRREVTIGELWESKTQHNSGLRRNLLRVLDADTGEFISNRVEDIHFNGVRPVFRVTTETGYTIKATSNHRFMSADGAWRELEAFAPGDLIAVNGAELPLAERRSHIRASHPSVDSSKLPPTAVMTSEQALMDHIVHYSRMEGHDNVLVLPGAVCVDCGTALSKKPGASRCRRCASKKENSAWNGKQAQEALASREGLATTARGRALQRDQLKTACEECGTDSRLHLHHINGDPWDGAAENLMTLCEPCHKRWHVRHGHKGKNPYLHKYLDYDRIVSIEALPAEPVYDLQMKAPHHNFVANGFVSHNSGPQVEINTSRLPPGEDITQMYPWKIWQSEYHDFQDSSPAVRFYQPGSNAAELLTVLEKFATLADEYSGIPRYMTGEHVAGAGRTSSGLAMLINNAAKSLKHVVANVDVDVITPMLERLYQHNLRYNADPDMLGDVRVVAKGAMSLVSREAAAVRRNEFLQVVLGSPLAQEIVGMPGAAELLRENAKLLDVNPDRLVPSREELEQRMAQQAMMQQAMLAMQAQNALPGPQNGPSNGPKGAVPVKKPAPTLPDGSRVGGRDSNNVSPRPNLR